MLPFGPIVTTAWRLLTDESFRHKSLSARPANRCVPA